MRTLTYRAPSLRAVQDHLVAEGYGRWNIDGLFEPVRPGLEISPPMGRRELTPAEYDRDGIETNPATYDDYEIFLVKLAHDAYAHDTDAEAERDDADEARSKLAQTMKGERVTTSGEKLSRSRTVVTSKEGFVKRNGDEVELVPDAGNPKTGPFGIYQ